MNFWQQLQQKKEYDPKNAPFFCVAPMADVTDRAFRGIIAKYSRHGKPGGGPDVMWTEFVSADGLASKGREHLLHDLRFSEAERPIVAQLFSSHPEKMEVAAEFVADLGFDGIDINMGCPDRTIEKQGAGAAMIQTPALALEVIAAAKRGIAKSMAAQAGKEIPLSVKTRVGYNAIEIDTWIPALLKSGISALAVHARTRKELSKTPAQWQLLRKVVALRDRHAPGVVIIGNGDVVSLADGIAKARKSGVDGVMVGRALFGNPWFFDSYRPTVAVLPKKKPYWLRVLADMFALPVETVHTAAQSEVHPITTVERLHVLMEHTLLFDSYLGDIKSFSIMKKHYKAYCNGFVGAKELRLKLMETNTSTEVVQIVQEFLKDYNK